MLLTYLGHACFLVEPSRGPSVLLDPFEPGGFGGRIRLRYPPGLRPDIVVVSHGHRDHSFLDPFPEAVVVDRPGSARGVAFRMAGAFHDRDGGATMGTVRMFAFTMDDVSICHPGDLGTVPKPEQVASLDRVDVLLLPVGGHFTVGPDDSDGVIRAFAPRLVIPMHYRSEHVALERMLPLAAFLAGRRFRKPGRSAVRLDPAALPRRRGILVLEPLGERV